MCAMLSPGLSRVFCLLVLLTMVWRGDAQEAQIVADFEGAHVGTVSQISENHFSCALAGQADQDGRNRQVSWYYFRLDNARGRQVTITFTGLRGEYNYKPGGISINDEMAPMISEDGHRWQHLAQMT
jgi:hypothetical protein